MRYIPTMLHAIHTMDKKNASHKLGLKILMYHHFVSIAPSDCTNRAYLKTREIQFAMLSRIKTTWSRSLSCPIRRARLFENLPKMRRDRREWTSSHLNDTRSRCVLLRDSIPIATVCTHRTPAVCVIKKFLPDNDRAENLSSCFPSASFLPRGNNRHGGEIAKSESY